jgi:hypothetical protein
VRYDPYVRGLACLLVLAASATAWAHPAQPLDIPLGRSGMPHARRPPPNQDDLLRPAFDPPDPCGTGKTWKQVAACLKKQGGAKIVYDTPTAKVVQIPFGGGTDASRLWLFIQTEKGPWIRASYSGYTNPQTELLGVTPYTAEVAAGLRVDIGNTVRTSFSSEQGAVTRGILRRVNTTVCLPTGWICRTITTACDAYVHGHLLWSFQAQIVWKAASGLRLRVDTSHAGGMCTPAKSMIDKSE